MWWKIEVTDKKCIRIFKIKSLFIHFANVDYRNYGGDFITCMELKIESLKIWTGTYPTRQISIKYSHKGRSVGLVDKALG